MGVPHGFMGANKGAGNWGRQREKPGRGGLLGFIGSYWRVIQEVVKREKAGSMIKESRINLPRDVTPVSYGT